MDTVNVRCCCTPGLVLGRVPDITDGWGLTVFMEGEPRTFELDFAHEVWATRTGPGREELEYFGWVDWAVNSDHTTVDQWLTVPGFELVCNMPEPFSPP